MDGPHTAPDASDTSSKDASQSSKDASKSSKDSSKSSKSTSKASKDASKVAKSESRRAVPPRPEKIRSARAKFDTVVLICAKCAKRQNLPKGTLRSVLKRAMKERAGSSKDRRAKPRLVEVGCLGPCPKRAVAVATTASLARGRIALVDPAGDRQAILAALLPDFGPKATLTPPGAPEDESDPRESRI